MGGRAGSQAEASCSLHAAVAADACGTADGRERNHGSTWTRTELLHAVHAVWSWLLCGEGERMATGGAVARRVASTLSSKPSMSWRSNTNSESKRERQRVKRAHGQGGPSGGQGGRSSLQTYRVGTTGEGLYANSQLREHSNCSVFTCLATRTRRVQPLGP